MVDEESPKAPGSQATDADTTESKPTRRRRAAARPAGPPAADAAEATAAPVKAAKRTTKRASAASSATSAPAEGDAAASVTPSPAFITPVFQAAEPAPRKRAAGAAKATTATKATKATKAAPEEPGLEFEDLDDGDDESGTGRRRRRRGGRGRRRRSDGDRVDGDRAEDDGSETGDDDALDEDDESDGGDDDEGAGSTRRRRRRRRSGDAEPQPDDPPNTVVRVREPREARAKSEDVGSLRGSTRLEAKKQRRREGREAGRRRAPILTEAEFLARREAVNRIMVVRQVGERTQIAVLEDGILVEHYVTRGAQGSLVGNVYLGRVQNVLPSMEAAFVDIGRKRNAVLYAGEVNWDAAGLEGQPKRIEFALKTSDPVLVQVTKDPVGQKGARLTSQISLPGRFLVYVPDGSMTGISRKLPDTERSRLKGILKRVMPEEAGVIVRTAAEGAPEDSLEQDISRLQAQWAGISQAAASATPPTLLYSEPDLAIKVVRDIFNEDVNTLIVSGDEAWQSVHEYVTAVAPDLADRLQQWVEPRDLFTVYRVDEQLAKALDRKVWLPSGGSLVIDRTEAMTVIDVNTGKFTGQGGNLEQTVTRNNLEAAEEIVRQLRLRDIGGIIVIDFIDMVLESNRDLVLRRLVECLGRDRTKHQVAEVTSLGLVQMTRKRIGSGLIESFSTPCEACAGRGLRVSLTADHDHETSPRHRRPPNAVDPADVAARMFEQLPDEVVDEEMPLVEDVVDEDAADQRGSRGWWRSRS
ncbi:MAG: Rne/Rng family ribonuclease [Actinomycetales bacterium]|nr:Rne/Rng family ribonuclease [Actinomycetales bacterium]